MKPLRAIIINAAVLILFGLWGYLHSPDNRSVELVPIVFGLLFLAAAIPVRLENRIVEFMLRVLLSLLVVALILSLITAIEYANTGNVMRFSLMTLVTFYTWVIYMLALRKRLIDRKKNRNNR